MPGQRPGRRPDPDPGGSLQPNVASRPCRVRLRALSTCRARPARPGSACRAGGPDRLPHRLTPPARGASRHDRAPCPHRAAMIGIAGPGQAESALAAGTLACPGCTRPLQHVGSRPRPYGARSRPRHADAAAAAGPLQPSSFPHAPTAGTRCTAASRPASDDEGLGEPGCARGDMAGTPTSGLSRPATVRLAASRGPPSASAVRRSGFPRLIRGASPNHGEQSRGACGGLSFSWSP